jgi:hypothetical protein
MIAGVEMASSGSILEALEGRNVVFVESIFSEEQKSRTASCRIRTNSDAIAIGQFQVEKNNKTS